MMRSTLWSGLWVVGAALAALPAQEVRVLTVEGRWLEGSFGGWRAGTTPGLVLRSEDGNRTLAAADVLSVHFGAPAPRGEVEVHLVGGDLLRGAISGGDEVGETFTVQSPSLGPVPVWIDRLRIAVFAAGARGRGADAFVLPERANGEALFRPVERGYETLLGGIHRFTEDGIVFEWEQGRGPRLYRYDRLAGVALATGSAAERRGDVRLVTRAGDLISGTIAASPPDRVVFVDEQERERALPLAEVSALTLMPATRQPLSALAPVEVEERGAEFEDARAPLYPFRIDRAATGGLLVAGGIASATGLGVHARCALTYEVPPGFHRLVGAVGIDDSAQRTGLRASASVSVEVDGEVVFGPAPVRVGQLPRSLGAITVRPGSRVILRADFGEGWFLGDRVDWLMPVFLP